MDTFRQHINAAKLSLSFGLVLALVCFFGSEVAHRAEQKPLSVASQLWYSVAANHSLFDKRVKDSNAFNSWPEDDSPSALLLASSLLAHALPNDSHYPLISPPALTRFSYQRPPLRAPPVV